MSRPIHLTPPEKERSPDWGRAGLDGEGDGGGVEDRGWRLATKAACGFGSLCRI